MFRKELINRALVSAAEAERMGFLHTADAFLALVADMSPRESRLPVQYDARDHATMRHDEV